VLYDRTKLIADALLDGVWHGAFFYPKGATVYAAQHKTRLVAVFDSRPLDPASQFAGWSRFDWSGSTPAGSELFVFFRSSDDRAGLLQTVWRGPFLNPAGASLSGQTGRFLQFRLALYMDGFPAVSPDSPSVDRFQVSAFQNGPGSGEHLFFTKTFPLQFVPKHILLTYNGTVPAHSLVEFGISSQDSARPGDYQLIQPNQVELLDELSLLDRNLKVMLRILAPLDSGFAVDEFALLCGGEEQDRLNS
jgi:hypothetical protein